MMPTFSPGLKPKDVLEAAGLMEVTLVNAITTSRFNPKRALFRIAGEKMCDSSRARVGARLVPHVFDVVGIRIGDWSLVEHVGAKETV